MTELPTWFVLGGLAVLGLLVGSFLNVVIHRVPAGASLEYTTTDRSPTDPSSVTWTAK